MSLISWVGVSWLTVPSGNIAAFGLADWGRCTQFAEHERTLRQIAANLCLILFPASTRYFCRHNRFGRHCGACPMEFPTPRWPPEFPHIRRIVFFRNGWERIQESTVHSGHDSSPGHRDESLLSSSRWQKSPIRAWPPPRGQGPGHATFVMSISLADLLGNSNYLRILLPRPTNATSADPNSIATLGSGIGSAMMLPEDLSLIHI